MADSDYPVKNGAGDTIIPGPDDAGWNSEKPHDVSKDYPVLNDVGDVIVEKPWPDYEPPEEPDDE